MNMHIAIDILTIIKIPSDFEMLNCKQNFYTTVHTEYSN